MGRTRKGKSRYILYIHERISFTREIEITRKKNVRLKNGISFFR